MFNKRREGDYEDFEETTEEEIQEAMPKVKALVDKLISLISLTLTNSSDTTYQMAGPTCGACHFSTKKFGGKRKNSYLCGVVSMTEPTKE